ncbi:hypothetical protein LTR84_004818 [Exophiala bonariae]|uniref:Pre-mRNA-splicing factor cwc26 n=1 Tax=Exophiala bonariae TaxID=1690606 RepID=A0AAV9NNY5_9EURO|nr:hypothetical protein LTR84_004818 [Exophiala bonariae]
MPSGSLAAYLAKNYLNASNPSESRSSPSNSDFTDSARPKKKRRKNKDSEPQISGLLIADDDAELSIRGPTGKNGDDEDEDVPMYDTNIKSAEFRKKKSSGWTVVDGESTATGKENNDEDAEADRIISEAAAESAQRRQEIEDEDAPAIVDVSASTTSNFPKMQSGARPGLQTAADTARLVEEEERERAREVARTKKSKKPKDVEETPEEETIYRDATGRRIDVSLKRAEARRAELEKIAAEKKARDEARGDVQRAEREQRNQDLEEAKFLTVARGADDEDMNRDMKEVVRWDDPMAMYMAQKKAEEREIQGPTNGSKGGGSGKGHALAAPRKKVYQGSAPPNRYGIAPGWRWDGVDRGNGFEKDWFQARGRKARNEDLSYQWQMDE